MAQSEFNNYLFSYQSIDPWICKIGRCNHVRLDESMSALYSHKQSVGDIGGISSLA